PVHCDRREPARSHGPLPETLRAEGRQLQHDQRAHRLHERVPGRSRSGRNHGGVTLTMAIDTQAIAQELVDAYATGDMLDAPLSSRAGFDLPAAYAIEAEPARRRRAAGRTVVGRKSAFANEAVWRKLNSPTVAWASM